MSAEEILLIVVSVAVVILIVIMISVLVTALVVLKKLKKVSDQLHQISIKSSQAAEKFAPVLGLLKFMNVVKKFRR